MILTNLGLNDIIIGKDSYYDLSNINTISFKTNRFIKNLNLIPVYNDRYIKWVFEIVNNSTLEDLPNGKIFLNRGFYEILIYNNSEIIYEDFLFLNIPNEIIYNINNIDDDNISYSIPN